MPASGGDPVTAALRLSLTASQGYEDISSIDKRLEASAARVLLTHIEYEPLGKSLGNVLTNLKSKYIVLRNQDAAKNGTDTASPSTTSDMPVSNAGSNHNRDMKPELDSVLPEPKITLFPAECVQLGWRGTHCVGAGMINVGNTCYLNSTLQALFHVPAFVNWLDSDSNHLSNCTLGNGSVNGGCIICAMAKTLKASQSKPGTIIKPFLIYHRLKSICRHLVHGQQEDAHEFMRYLLESMEKAFLTRYKGSNRLDSYSKETTPLNQIFGGYIRTEVTCLQCGDVSTTFQHCQDFLLDIQRASTLDDALAAYFCKEQLDGDDAYHCERCQRKVSATKKFSLEKPPQVLCLQFKRFSILGGKINKNIIFSQRLDLTRFLCPQSAHRSPVPLTYQLVSMVTHVGSSVHCGHYTAIAQTSPGHYYQFDDSVVRPISLSAVLDTNAYIMLYECEPRVQPQVSSMSVQSAVSATATAATFAVNGQKPEAVQEKPVQGPAKIPENHNIGPVMNNRPSSISMTNHKEGCDSNSAVNTCASPMPPAKDRDRVVFDMHQPAVSPAPQRLVMQIKNGKVYYPPPHPSSEQPEPSASAAASSAASLVPYCESDEDESSSDASEAAPPCSWDMPSLGEVSPSSPHSKPVLVCNKVPTMNNFKENFISSAEVPASREMISSLASGNNQNPTTVCTAVGESVHTMKSDVSSSSTSANSRFVSISDLGGKISSELKSPQVEDIYSKSSIGFVPRDKCKVDNARTDQNDSCFINRSISLLPGKGISENSHLRKVDVSYPSQSRNSSVSHSKNGAESMESSSTINGMLEIRGRKVSPSVTNTTPEDRQSMDLASSKELTEYSTTVNLRVNVSHPAGRGKSNTGWQVTNLLHHSPYVASESSNGSNSVANSTTGWDVSDVEQKCNYASANTNKLAAHKSPCPDSYVYTKVSHSEVKLLKDEPDVKKNALWRKLYLDGMVPNSPSTESEQRLVNGDSKRTKSEMGSVNVKKRKHSDSATSCEEMQVVLSPSSQRTKRRQVGDSSIEECTSKHHKKREKKLKKLKKHKKKEKSTADASEGSETVSDNEDERYEWVEKTHETLGLSTAYRAETNGRSWDGAYKSDVTNHLTNLSHQGYGSANVTNWAGERSRMDIEVERDHREHRKRSYNNAFDEDFDKGRVKKVKHHHVDSYQSKLKYNPFQDYHNYKHKKWGNGNGGDYYCKPHYREGFVHYNTYHPRHKQFAGRNNGYRNRNKYHIHYNKRNHWRH